MHLYRLTLVALVSLAAAAAEPPAKEKEKEKGESSPPAKETKTVPSLTVGTDLPGPFHPFNINGPAKDRFHCVVSQQGLDPMVLVFVRDLQITEPLKDLLRRLDAACVKNPNVRLACAAVFLSDDLTRPVEMDDLREELASKLRDLADELKLKQVVLCVDGLADVEKYDLDREKAAYTVVLFRKLKVVATESICATS